MRDQALWRWARWEDPRRHDRISRARMCAAAKWDFQNELREDPEIALALLPVLSALRELDALLVDGRAPAPAG